MPDSIDYSAGPWTLLADSSSHTLRFVHVPTGTLLSELVECPGIHPELMKLLKFADSAAQEQANLTRALHEIHALAGHYESLAMKAATRKEQSEILLEGMGAMKSRAHKAVPKADG